MTAVIERTMECARTGQHRSVAELIRHMPVDDRPAIEAHLAIPGARRALILMCSEAWLAARLAQSGA